MTRTSRPPVKDRKLSRLVLYPSPFENYSFPMSLLRWTVGLILLTLQVGAIAYARLTEARYFCWAPYDMQTQYKLQAVVNSVVLTPQQIQQRYRRPREGRDNRSPQHLKDIFEQTERHYHAEDQVDLILTYRINGKEERTWRYLQP